MTSVVRTYSRRSLPEELLMSSGAHRRERGRHRRGHRQMESLLDNRPGKKFSILQPHEPFSYLGQRRGATMRIGVHHGLIGSATVTPVDPSDLADVVRLLRCNETRCEVHQAISVTKKRGGAHALTIRDFRMENGGVHIHAPLRDFRSVLTGVPVLDTNAADLHGGNAL